MQAGLKHTAESAAPANLYEVSAASRKELHMSEATFMQMVAPGSCFAAIVCCFGEINYEFPKNRRSSSRRSQKPNTEQTTTLHWAGKHRS